MRRMGELEDQSLAVDPGRVPLNPQELAASEDAASLGEGLAERPARRARVGRAHRGGVGQPRELGLGRHFLGVSTVRRLRPFLRRADRILRPLWVAMRARNPCVFFRFRLWG